MDILKFKLVSNNKVIIDEKVNYYIKEGVLKFKIEDTIYEYDTNKDILLKKDKESALKIEILNNNIIITLLPTNISFDMEIFVEKYEKKENSIFFEYTFMSDEKTTNCIFIDY